MTTKNDRIPVDKLDIRNTQDIHEENFKTLRDVIEELKK